MKKLKTFILLLLSNSITLIRDKSIFYSAIWPQTSTFFNCAQFLALFRSIICSLRGRYNKHSKHLNLSVLIIGITIITYLLGLSFFYCTILVLYIIIILAVLPLIIVNYMDFRDTLGLLGLFIFIIFDTLTELVMTTEFHTNYQNLSQIDIFLIYLGTARIIFDIYFTKNKGSYFDRIKTILKKY